MPARAIAAAILCLYIAILTDASRLSAADFTPAPPIDPAFTQNVEIWMTTAAPSGPQTGTETQPFSVGGSSVTFDKFMSRFRGTRFVTFRLMPGVYHTSGIYEVPPNKAFIGDWWEPGEGWRILGSGTNATFLELDVPRETTPTKYHIIGNSVTGSVVHHLEIAYITLNAHGSLYSRTIDSNFGAIYIGGSYIYLHDLNCVDAFNALSPAANNAGLHRELFILGIGGRDGFQVTNNIIRRCVVTIPIGNPKQFPGSIEGLTTAILNASNANGRDDINDLTCVPRITECLVVGNDVTRRVNGISIFGATNGWAASNIVLNVRFGFYSDDSPWNPSLYVVQNFFSNTIHGVYLNYSTNLAEWGSVAVVSNVVYLNNQWSNESTNFTAGVNMSGSNPLFGSPTFDQVVIASNTVTMVGGPSAARIQDFGVLQQGVRRSLTIGNSIGLFREENALKYLPEQSRGETYFFCGNTSFAGLALWAHDRSLPNCRLDNPLDPLSCLTPPVCLEPTPFTDYFKFALTWPRSHPYPSGRAPGRHWVWEAEDGDIVPPCYIDLATDAAGGKCVVSTNLNHGGVRFTIYLPLSSRKYNLWAKILPPNTAATGFYDVEIDGNRRFFGATQDNDRIDWIYRVVTERIPLANTNITRRTLLDPGWHTIAFWSRDAGVKLDQLLITTSTEDDFVPNAAIVSRLGLGGKLATETANQCPSDQTIEAEAGILSAPLTIVDDPLASGGRAVMSRVSDRGEVVFTIGVPKTHYYALQLRTKPASAPLKGNTASVLLDGREWILTCGSSDSWSWFSVIEDTEGATRAPASTNKVVHLTQGFHRLSFRTRNPGVGLDAVRISETQGP
ncbi:MAG: hypothetical protein HYR88_10170 [Verrucomicrobia bacterium]|nr:hypothetical protein [Verrucomicrobiota bacterium]MBI3868474.1 hypothetical protein [Verrucomicrobiota bacterium]